ncbi:MAG: hypothetical protein CMI01_18385 [Oceanospirillaceae bacterium]|nr:hypothetical protein [Oceanospirillaceae bacterium]
MDLSLKETDKTAERLCKDFPHLADEIEALAGAARMAIRRKEQAKPKPTARPGIRRGKRHPSGSRC